MSILFETVKKNFFKMSSNSLLVNKIKLSKIDLPPEMTLKKCLEETQEIIFLILSNKMEETKKLLDPWCKKSMYHSLGSAVITFLEAVLTFEQKNISNAMNSLNESLLVCDNYRKKNTIYSSITNLFSKIKYIDYTELQLHAELCYAECLLLKGVLTLLEDETLMGLVKGALRIRTCYGKYKICEDILKCSNWDKWESKPHFEGGVLLGVGSFNLLISLLPPRVIKLVEMIGFPGDREIGLNFIEASCYIEGVRQPLARLIFLAYNLIVVCTLTDDDGDYDKCESLIENEMKKYQGSIWFYFFKARLELVKGNTSESILLYNKTCSLQDKWRQLNHICFWELFWIYSLQADWKSALIFIAFLLDESKWSKTIYTYLKAALFMMLNKDKEEIVILMKEVPVAKQRIAGKSLPVEKFVISKSERFFKQNENLLVPMIEMLYLFNFFKIFRKNKSLSENIHTLIDLNMENVLKDCQFDKDNKAMLFLLKGACLKNIDSYLESLKFLQNAIDMKLEIREDNYIVPFAMVEMAMAYVKLRNCDKAIELLNNVKKNFSGYALESRLHFKIHAILAQLEN